MFLTQNMMTLWIIWTPLTYLLKSKQNRRRILL